MSTELFSFTVAQPYSEHFDHPIDVAVAEGGRRVRKQRVTDNGLFVVSSATIRFPRNTLSTWEAFWLARKGPYDSWLYLPVLTVHKSIADEAIGTSSGGAGESFALDCKYIKASTLVVKVGAVDQDGDWNLTGNNTAPLVNTEAGFDAGSVTASYDRYIPCTFTNQALPAIRSLGSTDATSIISVLGLTWMQDYSGSHLV